MDMPLMKCGCVSQGHRVLEEARIPACLVHDCIEVADETPDLAGRTAQCTYLPHGHAPKPSSLDLAFFVYRGPGSPEATDKCKCGYSRTAHYPRWRAEINVVRRWFDHDRYEEMTARDFHAPSEPPELRAEIAERKADFFRTQTRDEKTRVFSATVESIKKVRSTLKCREFEPHGPHEFDQYYCGCHGWE